LRKNKNVGKNLTKNLFTKYEISGLNFDRLLIALKKNGISLYNVKKTSSRKMFVSVNFSDNEKFFAIVKDLCYNVKKVKDYGKTYPLLFLWRNLGLVLGLAFFIAATVFFNDTIFAFSYSGSGLIYKSEVESYLADKGITVWSRFSSLDLKRLGGDILEKNPHLSFVSCEKVGNRLKIELVLSETAPKNFDGEKTELLAPEDGVIETLKVYRGTAMLNEGDTVKAGDVLVVGNMTVKDHIVDVNVIATAGILAKREFVFVSALDGEEEKAIAFAEAEYSDYEIRSSGIEKTLSGEEYIYKVTLTVLVVVLTG